MAVKHIWAVEKKVFPSNVYKFDDAYSSLRDAKHMMNTRKGFQGGNWRIVKFIRSKSKGLVS